MVFTVYTDSISECQAEGKHVVQIPGGLDAKPLTDVPLEVFPDTFRAMILAVSEAVDGPVGYAAAACLSAVATAAGGSVEVVANRTWRRFPVLWVALVGRPGDGKTPATAMMLKPLLREEERLYRQWRDSVDEWESRGEDGPKPVRRRLMADDATAEAVVQLLGESEKGLLLAPDELSQWYRSFASYKSTQKDRSFYLKAWSESPIVVDRVARAGNFVPRHCLGVVGSLQDDLIQELAGHDDDGLIDRMLLAYPGRVPEPHPPIGDGDDGVPEGVERAYDKAIGRLLDLKSGENGPLTLPLSRGARSVFRWLQYGYKSQARTLDGEGPGEDIGFIAKFGDHVLRLSLVAKLMRYASGEEGLTEIDEASVRSGHDLFRWFRGQRLALFGLQKVGGKVGRLVRWARRRGATVVSARSLTTSRIARSSDEAISIFRQAEALGFGSVVERKENNGTYLDFHFDPNKLEFIDI